MAGSRGPAFGRGVRVGFALAIVPLLAGASYRTPNFVVEAPTAEAARRVGDHAETRGEKGLGQSASALARHWPGFRIRKPAE